MLTSAKIFIERELITNGTMTKHYSYAQGNHTTSVFHFQQCSLNFRTKQFFCKTSYAREHFCRSAK